MFLKKNSVLALALILSLFSLDQLSAQTDTVRSGDYTYVTVEGDPLSTRIYTLDNGLKVYLSENNDAPRVQTYVAVRTGSKNDPADATGLAHYLEHMMFKGTSIFGTLDWEMENKLINQISDLYEEHRNTDNEEEKRAIYDQIDSLSQIAASYTIPNEYDKMMSSIGVKGTNAYTWLEQTVYINDVPSNQLEKWAKVEAERFGELVLRLFHTELEAVYEEFNRGQDSDFRKAWYALMENLFQKHPYGTQTTIGKGEHLKNPSMEKIHEYYETYYVPNNMAVAISGDINPDETIRIIDKYFGDMEAKEVPEFTFEPEEPIKEPIVKDVYGSQGEFLMMGYRFDGVGSEEADLMQLADMILLNGQAGLMDLNLVQQQKVLDASTSPMIFKDYSWLSITARPREGQSLEEVKGLVLEQLDKLKAGEFEDWLLKASVKNLKLRRLQEWEENSGRAHAYVDAFIQEVPWEQRLNAINRLEKYTKEDVVNFAKEHFKDNYVVVYKHLGQDTSIHKVEKPTITPIQLNRDTISAFHNDFLEMEVNDLQPVFIDYDEAIDRHTLNSGVPLYYIENTTNDLFSLYYILDMGKNHDKKMGLAVEYLPYLGTNKYTAEELQEEFYKLGLSFNVFSSADKLYVSLGGLSESYHEGLELLEHILKNVEPDAEAYDNLVQGILKERENAKKEKSIILRRGLMNYAKYGAKSPFTNVMSTRELKLTRPQELTTRIKNLENYKHRVFYYGPLSSAGVKDKLNKLHDVPSELLNYPEPVKFEERSIDSNKVFYTNYDMVQAEFILLTDLWNEYDPDRVPEITLFNNYFGSGLSSIVFQEIREAKALAYSAYSVITTPDKKDKPHYMMAYVGTQADKLPDALTAIQQIIEDMPVSEKQLQAAKDAVRNKIASERVTKKDIFWSFEDAKDMGLDHDIRKDIYQNLDDLSLEDIKKFHSENIKGKNYNLLIIGKDGNLNMDVLNNYGKVKKLSLEEIYGY